MEDDTIALLPLHYSEFLTWYKFGTRKVLGFCLIPVELNEDGNPDTDQSLAERVALSIPDYEEDFEVLLALIRVPHPVLLLEYQHSSLAPAFKELPIVDLLALYPITQRGRQFLETKLDTDIILGEPLWEDAILSVEERRSFARVLGGAEALLRIGGLESYHESLAAQYEGALRRALKMTGSRPTHDCPVEYGTFIENLSGYSRYDFYPKEDVGYLYDLGKVIQTYKSSHPHDKQLADGKDSLKNLKKALEEQRKSRLDLPGLIRLLGPQLTEVDALIADLCPAGSACSSVSCVVFLKLRDEIRKCEGLSGTGFDRLVDALRGEYEKELALGCWLTGAYFEFPMFAQQYYTVIKAPFLRTSQPKPDELGAGAVPPASLPGSDLVSCGADSSGEAAGHRATDKDSQGTGAVAEPATVSPDGPRASVDSEVLSAAGGETDTGHLPGDEDVPQMPTDGSPLEAGAEPPASLPGNQVALCDAHSGTEAGEATVNDTDRGVVQPQAEPAGLRPDDPTSKPRARTEIGLAGGGGTDIGPLPGGEDAPPVSTDLAYPNL